VDGLSIGKQAAPLAHACDVCVVRVWGARACGAEGTCGEWNGCQRVGPDTALRGVSGGRGLRRRAEGGVANGPSPSGLAKRRASCTLPPAASTHVLLRAHPATAPEGTLGRPPQCSPKRCGCRRPAPQRAVDHWRGKGGSGASARRDGGKGGKCGGAGACMYLCELSGAELIGKERETKKEWTFGPDAIWDRRGGLPPARPMLQARGARGASRAKGA
jgi:hypothetical protein